jgi:hypothetical protein
MRAGSRRAPTAILAVNRLAPVIDARGLGLRAICKHVQQFGQLGIAVLLDELRDAIAAAPAAGCALDREGGDPKVREGVRVVSHASGGPRVSSSGWRRRAEIEVVLLLQPTDDGRHVDKLDLRRPHFRLDPVQLLARIPAFARGGISGARQWSIGIAS